MLSFRDNISFLIFFNKCRLVPSGNSDWSTYSLFVNYVFLQYIYGTYKDNVHTIMNSISISKDIEPLSEFRKKSADFIKRLKKEKQPIILTQHGKSAAVLMDVTEYERFSKKLELLEDLLEAKQQVEKGETYTMDEARKRIEKHLSKWK